jgi:hypothetical protein
MHIEHSFLVADRQLHPPGMRQAGMPQFEAQAFLISGFEQPGSECAVDFDRQSNDLVCQPVGFIRGHDLKVPGVVPVIYLPAVNNR